MAAVTALAGSVIFEKFNQVIALRAFYLENSAWFPVLCILTRAFHRDSPFKFRLANICFANFQLIDGTKGIPRTFPFLYTFKLNITLT